MHPLALLAGLRGRYRSLFRRGGVEQQLSEEVRFHLEMETEANVAAGMSPEEARRAAVISFGGVERFREEHRDVRGTRLIEDALDDIRYGVRSLARTPSFVGVSVFTLAIAIAVGASLFTAVNGFFFRALPVPDGKDLVSVFTSDFDGGPRGGSSYRDLLDFAQAGAPVAELVAEARLEAAVEIGDDVAMLDGVLVSPGYFAALRLTPALGRFPAIARADEPTVVISQTLWQRAFTSDPSVIGRPIEVNGQVFRVAAVAPPQFLGTMRETAEEFWIDAAFSPLLLPGEALLTQRGNRRFHVLGRLRDGASLPALEARLDIVAARLREEDPNAWIDKAGRGRHVSVQLERDARNAEVARDDLLVLVGGVTALGLALLALASTNLASLQMARAAARRREIATRLALGAGRRRLVRQLLTESAVIAVPGGALGLALASATSLIATRYRPPGLPAVDLALDWRSLLFAASGVLLSLLVFGLVPALQSLRGDVLTALKDGETLGRRGMRVGGIRGGLLIGQVALSVMFTAASLLVAGALGRYAGESRVDAAHVLVAPLSILPTAGDSLGTAGLVRDIAAQLAALPGIEAASAAYYVPDMGSRITVEVTQREAGGTNGPRSLDADFIRPRYFDVIGLPLLRGRDFSESEMAGRTRVAIVSSVLAARLWPGVDPIGRQLRVGQKEDDVEIIGVAAEQRSDVTRSSRGLLYLPMTPRRVGGLVLHLRVNGATPALVSSVTRVLRPYNRRIVATEVVPIARYVERALMPQRITAQASAVLALLQLVLAVTGLSGLVAYVIAQRRREIGIRAALGARRMDILSLVLRQGARLAIIGGAVGAVLSFIVGRVVATTLPATAALQIGATAAAVCCFTVVAIVAMLWLARRALAVPPATALRLD